MLIRLSGDQIARYWKSMIKDAIIESLPMVPAELDKAMNTIMAQMLQDKLQCWAVTTKDSNEPLGICTTQATIDSNTGERSMLIYTTTAFDSFPDDLWVENYLQLAEFAKGVGCVRIYCYSDNPRVIEKAKECGADSAQVLLSFPLL